MDSEPISASPSEVKTLTEISISQSSPIEEKDIPNYLSIKSTSNATEEKVLSPEVSMR